MSGIEVLGAIASTYTLFEAVNKIVKALEDVNIDTALPVVNELTDLCSETINHFQSGAPSQQLYRQNDRMQNYLDLARYGIIPEIETATRLLSHFKGSSRMKRIRHAKGIRVSSQRLNEHYQRLSQCLQFFSMERQNYFNIQLKQQVDGLTSMMLTLTPTSLPVTQSLTLVANSRPVRSKRLPSSVCRRGLCLCPCHRPVDSCKSSVAVSYPSLINRCRCEEKEFCISIAMMQRFLNVRVCAGWENELKIDLSLHYQRTVKYTSPGFLILEKCAAGMLDFTAAYKELKVLRDYRQLQFDDVNPAGEGLLETIVSRPWKRTQICHQVKLLQWLIEQTSNVDYTRLLNKSLKWVGEGPFLQLLEVLSRSSLDTTCLASSVFSSWPRASSPEWLSAYCSDDPFFVFTLCMLTKNDPGFGGCSNFHIAAFQETEEICNDLLQADLSHLNEQGNFLGQRALHLAIINPWLVQNLLTAFPDLRIDVADNAGTTPLMYAMMYQKSESVQLLLEAGANPFLRDTLNKFCAWDYALVSQSTIPMEQGLESLENLADLGKETFRNSVAYCLWQRVISHSFESGDFDHRCLRTLLQYEIGKDLITPDGNTLLHLCGAYDIGVLLEQSDWPINHANVHGYTPLMAISRFHDRKLVRAALGLGSTVHNTDERGRNALHHCLGSFSPSRVGEASDPVIWFELLSIAALLLSSGLDLTQTDNCVCHCSEAGCTAPVYQFYSCGWWLPQQNSLSAVPWTLELWMVLSEYVSDAKSLTLALYRRQRFDELGITHTCCNRSSTAARWRGGNDRSHSTSVRARDDSSTCGVINRSGRAVIGSDVQEIWDEEEVMIKQLDADCGNTSIFMAADSANIETTWIDLLARRAAMIEEALHKIEMKRQREIQEQRVLYERHRVQLERDNVQIITETPLFYVDYKNDRLGRGHGVGFSTYPKLTVTQGYLSDYLAACEKNPDFLQDVLGEDHDVTWWKSKRMDLVSRFEAKVNDLRQMTAEERDWDMRTETE